MTSRASLPEYGIVARWTVNDVCNWLMENKFSTFVSMFREGGVDGCRLAELTDVDMLRMRCPHNKKLDLLRCIENIPGKKESRSRKPAAAPPSNHHRPPPSLPPSNGSVEDDEVYSDPDDDVDYEWNDFDASEPEDSDTEDYENHPPKPINPKKSGSGSDYDQPDNSPAPPPPRPVRPGQVKSSAPKLPAVPSPSKASNAKRGRAAIPEPEEQPEYEDPNETAPSIPSRPGARSQALPPRPNQNKSRPPPQVERPARGRQPAPLPSRPPPPVDDQEVYEDPDAEPEEPEIERTPTKPPPPRGRQPAPLPSRPPPPVDDQEVYEDPDAQSDEQDDFYEDPDAQPPPKPSQSRPKNLPIPKSANTSKGSKLPPRPMRLDSQPDTPAPPVPRHHQRRDPPKLPPTPVVNDDDDDDDQDDYEKPSPVEHKSAPKKNLPPRKSQPPPPQLDDLPGYMEMAPKEVNSQPETQEEYEVPDLDIVKPSGISGRGPPPPVSKAEKKSKVPSRPPGGVPVIPLSSTNGTPSKQDTTSKTILNEDHSPLAAEPAVRPQPRPRHIAHDQESSILSRPLPPNPTKEDEEVKTYAWFHDVTRQVADRELQKHAKNGMFLVRRSTKPAQPYTLVIYSENKIYNLPIRCREDNRYALGKYKSDEQSFDHVADLVEFFKTHTLILAASGSGQTRLKQCLPR